MSLSRWSFVLLLFVCTALSVKEELFEDPEHFPSPDYNFKKNPLSAAKIALGRELFYDPLLSADNTISCASCHSPFNGFAHTDHALSHGINDAVGTRNAPALFNLAWQTSFMWDGAINHLDVQALAPLSHPGEMGSELKAVVVKLEKSRKYVQLFKTAYKDGKITGERILKAIAQFELTLVSANSKYDKVQLGKAKFTDQEQKGYDIFVENCNNCHTEPLFTNDNFADIALPYDPYLKDAGRMKITGDSADSMLFRVPSLRNLSYTFPYMHDGRFRKLSEVINYYEQNRDRATDNRMKYMRPLSSVERVDLTAFLLTLNDSAFVFNAKHGFPDR